MQGEERKQEGGVAVARKMQRLGIRDGTKEVARNAIGIGDGVLRLGFVME
jgi:hypothetical protein